MPSAAKYITILLLLLCSLQNKAQRQIEWYEPDFDSAYARHWLMYNGLFDKAVPHLYSFYSRVAKQKKVKAVLRMAKGIDEKKAKYRFIAFDTAGFIRRIVYYSREGGSADTTANENYTYAVHGNGIAVKKTTNAVGYEEIYFFNASGSIDSLHIVGIYPQDFTEVFSYTYDSMMRVNRFARGVVTSSGYKLLKEIQLRYTDMADVTDRYKSDIENIRAYRPDLRIALIQKVDKKLMRGFEMKWDGRNHTENTRRLMLNSDVLMARTVKWGTPDEDGTHIVEMNSVLPDRHTWFEDWVSYDQRGLDVTATRERHFMTATRSKSNWTIEMMKHNEMTETGKVVLKNGMPMAYVTKSYEETFKYYYFK